MDWPDSSRPLYDMAQFPIVAIITCILKLLDPKRQATKCTEDTVGVSVPDENGGSPLPGQIDVVDETDREVERVLENVKESDSSVIIRNIFFARPYFALEYIISAHFCWSPA